MSEKTNILYLCVLIAISDYELQNEETHKIIKISKELKSEKTSKILWAVVSGISGAGIGILVYQFAK